MVKFLIDENASSLVFAIKEQDRYLFPWIKELAECDLTEFPIYKIKWISREELLNDDPMDEK